MIRLAALALLLGSAAPAFAQDDPQALAAAFSQADLNMLGECQARVGGAMLVHAQFEGWLYATGETQALAGVTKAASQAETLMLTINGVRRQVGQAPGLSMAGSDSAHDRMLEQFKKLPGEDNRTAYTRMQPLTVTPPDCSQAMKRARAKISVDGLPELN